MKNLSIFEPQIEKDHAYKKNMYRGRRAFDNVGIYIIWKCFGDDMVNWVIFVGIFSISATLRGQKHVILRETSPVRR